MSRLFEEFPPVSTAEWKAEIARDLKGRAADALGFVTDDGIEIKPFYRGENLDDVEVRRLYGAARWKIGCEVTDEASARYALSRGAEVLIVETSKVSLGDIRDVEIIRCDSVGFRRAVGSTPVEQIASMIDDPELEVLDTPIGPDYFQEIAKFRALQILSRRLCCKSVRILARSSPGSGPETYMNVLRSTTQAMSAIIGGADIVVIEPADLAGDLGRRLAINTQLILREEARFGGMEDPAGGCWFLEWLTDQFVTQVEDLI